jgi:hypothetical protein
MKWYEANFGSIAHFDLVKLAHNDYKEHRLENLYLPYNKKKGEIGNIKKLLS